MPVRSIPGTDLPYYLLSYDENGRERAEADGSRLSASVRAEAGGTDDPVTDIFLASHGWKGDLNGAIHQYDRWFAAMAGMSADRAAARAKVPGFRSLVVGVHWPSKPWGDERMSKPGVLSGDEDGQEGGDPQALVESYAARIADTPQARAAIGVIAEAATAPDSATLTPQLQAAYSALYAESGLDAAAAAGPPGADHDGFDPQLIIDEAKDPEGAEGAGAGGAVAGPGVLGGGGGSRWRDLLLSPLRQLSFWKMKDRARSFGETGAHDLIAALQAAAPGARIHLMGHSFGCIVVSAAVAGRPGGPKLGRPVDSLFLVQGALSLWSMADDVPYAPGSAGYFARILRDDLVRGPVVTTRSSHDTAVGRYYPLGAQIKKQLLLGPQEFPKYGGVGTFGLQGLDVAARDQPIQGEAFGYGFEGHAVYNIDASTVIAKDEGPSGAHSDIAHPQVAHLQWQAALTLPA